MGVSDAESERVTSESDQDEESAAVLRTVGKVVKTCRERMRLSRSELGAAIGYGDDQIYSVELGRRVPKPEFLDAADRVLEAGGLLSKLKEDVEGARYPKKVRDLARLEAQAVELGAFANVVVHGLLQTEEYARALYELRRPAYAEEEIDVLVAARMARQDVLVRKPPPMLTFVQDEVTLRRPVGGTMVLRRQLERLLEVGRLRHVNVQVMPTDQGDHAGLAGPFQVLKMADGSIVGHSEARIFNRVTTAPTSTRLLDLQYGIIRSQALSPRGSLSFIERLLGDA